MATSSIDHNFVIDTVEGAERFARALESAEANYRPQREPKGRELRDAAEILRFLNRRKKLHV